jgi:WD40 repeat protein/energy-coupling factor transporter ATP-binding protein EcfA2
MAIDSENVAAEARPVETEMPFETFQELRSHHRGLLQRFRREAKTKDNHGGYSIPLDLLNETQAFLSRGSASGVWMGNEDERMTAQTILDYWVATLPAYKDELPDATLTPFATDNSGPTFRDDECPYPGMRPYTEDIADKPFIWPASQDDILEQVVARLMEEHFVAIVGLSGSGKTSLVMRGLVPRLEQQGLPDEAHRHIIRIVPGSDPIRNLVCALYKERFETRPTETWTQDRMARLEKDPRAIMEILTELDIAAGVLIVDQFEEVHTLADPERSFVQEAYVECLLALLQDPSRHYYLVLTLRQDYVDRFGRYKSLAGLIEKSQLTPRPFIARELEQIILEPARKIGLEFEQGVVEDIINDIVGQPGCLPLLQFTLRKLWEQRQNKRITRAAYRRFGNARLFLERSADEFVDSLDKQKAGNGKKELLYRILMRVVRPGENYTASSHRVPRTRLHLLGGKGEVDSLLKEMLRAGLLRMSQGETEAEDQFEVSHETLIRHWPQLVNWIAAERHDIAMRRKLEACLDRWKQSKEQAGLLIEEELAEANSWINTPEARRLGFDPDILKLITASKEAIERQETAKQAQLDQEIASRKVAEARGLAALALATAESGQMDVALLLGQAAYKTSNTPVTRQALLTVLGRNPQIETYLREHKDMVYSVAFSPDGETFASADRQGDIYLWEVNSRRLRTKLPQVHKKEIDSITFSPDGRWLASGSRDGTIGIWDVVGEKLRQQFYPDAGVVWSVSFRNDSQTLASGHENGTILLWNIETDEKTPLDLIHNDHKADDVVCVVFNHDGTLLASGGLDNSIALWDSHTGKHLGTSKASSFQDEARGQDRVAAIYTMDFSRNGRLLAAGTKNGDILLWDVTQRAAPCSYGCPLKGHKAAVWSLAFHPKDDRLMVSSSQDGTLLVWDVQEGRIVGLPLIGHGNDVNDAAFSPDGKWLASGGDDGNVIFWDFSNRVPLLGHHDGVTALAISPEGDCWASADRNGTVLFWETHAHLTPTTSMRLNDDSIWCLAYSPDGKWLAYGGYYDTLKLWNRRKQHSRSLQENRHAPVDYVMSIAFHPRQPGLLAAGDSSGQLKLWDISSMGEGEVPSIGPIQQIEGRENDIIWCVKFSPDGKYLATAHRDGRIVVRDGTTLEIRYTLAEHKGDVVCLDFSPDGRTLVSGSRDKTLRIWDMSQEPPVGQFFGRHNSLVRTLCWSRDGKHLLSGGSDSAVILWEAPETLWPVLKTAPIGIPLRGHYGTITTVQFSLAGDLMLSAADDKTIFLWNTCLAGWQERPCRIANRDLSLQEWKEMVGEEEYRSVCSE